MFLTIFPFVPIMLVNSESYYNFNLLIKISIGLFGYLFVIFVVKKYYKLLLLLFFYCFSHLLPYLISQDINFQEVVLRMYFFGIFVLLIIYMDKYMEDFIEVLYFIGKLVIFLYICYFLFYLLTSNLNIPILYNNRNAIQTYMTFVIGVLVLRNNYYNKKIPIRDYLTIIIAFSGILFSGSATGIVSLVAGIFVLLFHEKISHKFLYITYMILFSIIVVLDRVSSTLVQFVLNLFSKSSTFSNRAWRWDFSITSFFENPLFGNSQLEADSSNYVDFLVEYFNPHNALLYILITSGVFGLILLILLLRKASQIQKSQISGQFYTTTLAMILVTGLMESNIGPTNFVFNLFILIAIILSKFYKKESYLKETYIK